METRSPAVAGLFYPAAPEALRQEVDGYLSAADAPTGIAPHALIVPHAGYRHSAAVAATAYALLRGHRYSRVVLIGPAHRVAFRGIALPSVEHFDTPLGSTTLDTDLIGRLATLPDVVLRDDAHALEHCLEVQLPFLQVLLPEFLLVPAVIGAASPQAVESFLDAAIDADTLVVVSTDLSHFHDDATARRIDRHTVARIESLATDLDGNEACGAMALNGFLRYAAGRHWRVARLDVRNSGDTGGDYSRVVGYGSFVVA
ncbi:AmmeMemoRadiSam system protein B [Sinimarinibacterium sp. CAU 1509]|uniref:AmmeMemoRadiSam system protein B n=1 Tax=Sinimarinibacterium sp. CAU 1509 TaxID=2562283 RepID=UPI001B7FD567|nr:AmmeMemoRadiSam system protein B [Sinimarinibacterium sp. CAU 1509]